MFLTQGYTEAEILAAAEKAKAAGKTPRTLQYLVPILAEMRAGAAPERSAGQDPFVAQILERKRAKDARS